MRAFVGGDQNAFAELVITSDSWDLFRSMVGGAINGGFTITESGR